MGAAGFFSMRLVHFVHASVKGVVLLLGMSLRIVSTPPLIGATVSFCCVGSTVGAAEQPTPKISYHLERGEAATTLRQFATISGSPVLFMMDKVQGEQTNAVNGEYSPIDALKQMLAGTSLEIMQEATVGGFVVGRQTMPVQREEEFRISNPQPQTKKMSRQSIPAKIRAWFAIAASTAASTAAFAAAPTTANTEEVLTLSPFEVHTDRDVGFAASSSLAGGRLSTELRDTPVAYSVVTRDFIEALGITDFAEAAQWTPNTTLALAVGGTANDVGNDSYNYTVRGAANGRPQRNFFLYYSPMDSYAIERYDFGRGPNAVLFGNGSLGGVSSSTTKMARFDRNGGEVSVGYGSWGKVRTTLDYNQVLSDKLAVRAAAMWTDADGWKDHQFDKSKGLFLTGTYKLTQKTSIRLETEVGSQQRNNTYSNLQDSLAGWDGTTVFNGALATKPANADAAGINLRGAGYWLYDGSSGQNAIMNYQGDPFTLSAEANQNVPISGIIRGSAPSFGAANSRLLYPVNLPAGMYDKAIAGSAFRLPSDSFTNAMDVPTLTQHFRDLQLTLDHRIGDVFIEMAIDHNRTKQFANTPDVRGGNVVYVDINKLLPNGATNPHFLQPYFDAGLRRYEDERNSDAFRLAVGTTKDFGKWGNYTVNMMGGYTVSDVNKIGVWNLSLAQNPDHRRWGASGQNLPSTDLILIRNYWNEPERPYTVPSSVRFINPLTGVDKTITPIWALEDDRSDSAQLIRSIYSYGIAAMTAKYWHEKIVILGAIRADNFYNYTRQQIAAGDYPLDWDGRTPYFKGQPPADYATLTYVKKDATGKAISAAQPADTRPRDANGTRLAQYNSDRFRDDYNGPAKNLTVYTPSVGGIVHLASWFNPYINYAETFNPPAIIQRLDSSFLPPTIAKGIDYGIRMSFLRGRVSVNVLQYENSEKNNAVDPGVQGNINTILSAAPLPALNNGSAIGRNLEQVPNVPGIVRDLQERTAKGKEVEIVANLTRSWRLMFNCAFPEIFTKNGLPDTIAYFKTNDTVLRKIVSDAGAIITTSASDPIGTATVNTGILVNDRSADVNAVVNAWNGLRNTRQSLVTGAAPKLTQDQPTMNIYTDYTFRTGKLKGLRLGAGWQWRGRMIIGNYGSQTIVDPSDSTKAIDDPTVDSTNPVRAPAWSNVQVNIAYSYLLKEHRELVFQLRVDNALNDRAPLWVNGTSTRPANGDYTSPAREPVRTNFTLRTPISYMLTTTLKF